MYKKYDLHYYRMNKQKYSLLIIDRKSSRKWAFIKDMKELIQTNYTDVYYSIVYA